MNMDFCFYKIACHRNIVPDPVQSAAERIQVMFIRIIAEMAQRKIHTI